MLPSEPVGELSAKPEPKAPPQRKPVTNKRRHKTETFVQPLSTGRQLGLLEGTDIDPYHPSDL